MKKAFLVILLLRCGFLAFPDSNDFAIEAFRKAISVHPGYRIYLLSILGIDCSEAIAAAVASKTGTKVTVRGSGEEVFVSEVKEEQSFFLNIAEWQRGTQFHTFEIHIWDGFLLNKLLKIEIEVNKDGRVVGSTVTKDFKY